MVDQTKNVKDPLLSCFNIQKPEMEKVKTFDCSVYVPKWQQQLGKLEARRGKCKFRANDDIGPSDVVQEIESGKVHFAKTIFKKKRDNKD